MSRLHSKQFRLTHLFWIRTKVPGYEGKRVTFNPNKWQRRDYNMVYCEKVRRIIKLKSRKFGETTFWCIDSLDEAAYGKRNWQAVTMAHDTDKSTEIFNDIVRFAWDHIPLELRPRVKYSNKTELVFAERGSKYVVTQDIKGATPNRLHITEAGYFEKDEAIIESINALPDEALCVAESTAHGVGNWFEQTFMEAWIAWKAGKFFKWRPVFHPWYEDPNNRVPKVEGMALRYEAEARAMREKLQAEGIELCEKQLFWWDQKKQDNRDLMYQFYPTWPEEAFLHSGRPVFDLASLAALKGKFARQPLRVEDAICVWEEPDLDDHYGIGVDTAEGLKHGDNSVIAVVSQKTGREVAQCVGKIAPHELARKLGRVCRMYGEHLCVIERNNHGHTVIAYAKEDEAINLYRKEVKDQVTEKVTLVIGWDTTEKSKAFAVNTLSRDLEDGRCVPQSHETYDELRTYVHGERGIMGAMPGKKDDRVIGLALANLACREMVVVGSLRPEHYGFY